MKIHRKLNNNAVVVMDNAMEKIVMGSGIAFQKNKNDIIPNHKIEKVFVLHQQSSEKFQQLLATLPEEHIELAEKIIDFAEGHLKEPLHDHIHIALTDHLSFALDRMKQGFPIQNKLTNEIKLLYTKEFEIGLWAKEAIKKKLEVDIPLDEVAHIALHIHTAKLGGSTMTESLGKATVLRDFIEQVEKRLNVKLDETTINYQRLMTHLHFALNRIKQGNDFDPIDQEMMDLIRIKYPVSYETSELIATYMGDEYGIHFPPSEVAYIALHIQRLL